MPRSFCYEEPYPHDILPQHQGIEVWRQDQEKLNAVITGELRRAFYLLCGKTIKEDLCCSGYPEDMETIH